MILLGWRNLVQNRMRLLISIGGVALSLLLILSLDAVLAGMESRISAYIDYSGGDVWVAQTGVRNMHMVSSTMPSSVVDEVRRIPGVADAMPIFYVTFPVTNKDRSQLAYVIGLPPGAPMGRPWNISAGSALPTAGEVVIDRSTAKALGVSLGDSVRIFGRSFTVAGLSEGSASIGSTIAFITSADFARLRRARNTVSYVLVKAAPGVATAELARSIQDRVKGVTALPREAFSSEERRLVKDMGADAVTIMNLVGLAIGLAAMALTTYVATLSRRAEYGMLKALGAGGRRLYGVVLSQAFISVGFGLIVAVAFTLLLAVLVPLSGSPLTLEMRADSVLKLILASIAIAGIAAVLPIRQIAGVDPAMVYRGGGR